MWFPSSLSLLPPFSVSNQLLRQKLMFGLTFAVSSLSFDYPESFTKTLSASAASTVFPRDEKMESVKCIKSQS